MNEYENMRTADIVAEALIDWNVNVIFGLPGDGINGVIEALRQRQNKIDRRIKLYRSCTSDEDLTEPYSQSFVEKVMRALSKS